MKIGKLYRLDCDILLLELHCTCINTDTLLPCTCMKITNLSYMLHDCITGIQTRILPYVELLIQCVNHL